MTTPLSLEAAAQEIRRNIVVTIREAALEEAAKVADEAAAEYKRVLGSGGEPSPYELALEIAQDIRALSVWGASPPLPESGQGHGVRIEGNSLLGCTCYYGDGKLHVHVLGLVLRLILPVHPGETPTHDREDFEAAASAGRASLKPLIEGRRKSCAAPPEGEREP